MSELTDLMLIVETPSQDNPEPQRHNTRAAPTGAIHTGNWSVVLGFDRARTSNNDGNGMNE